MIVCFLVVVLLFRDESDCSRESVYVSRWRGLSVILYCFEEVHITARLRKILRRPLLRTQRYYPNEDATQVAGLLTLRRELPFMNTRFCTGHQELHVYSARVSDAQ